MTHNPADERRDEGSVNDLWGRMRQYRDDHKELAGEMLADRRVSEERHMQNGEQFRRIEGGLGDLSRLVTSQMDIMNRLDRGQNSILQTMESDKLARLQTAEALAASDTARREAAAGPWVTPNRVITVALGTFALVAYVNSSGLLGG